MVAAELESLGVQVKEIEPAGVAFEATPLMLFRVNCWSRLATRILVRLDTFPARDFATLEKRARRVPWGDVLQAGDIVELSVTCRKSRLYHSDAVAERIARGIAMAVPGVALSAIKALVDDDADDADDADDQADNDVVDGGHGMHAKIAVPTVLTVQRVTSSRTPHGRATTSQRNSATTSQHTSRVQRILVRFDHDVCTISADASGELLHRRGWRLDSGKAPLRETLAAALITASGWTADVPFIDPMCGAGTIAIEAALRARNIAPGLSRTFSCEFWPHVKPEIALAERERAASGVLQAAPAAIIAADRDAGAMEATRTNAQRAGVLQDLTLVQKPLSDTRAASLGARGWIVTNPPYGVRTGDPHTLPALWGRLGAAVREAGPGWTLAAVAPDPALAKEIRLPLDRVVVTTTGGRQVAFVRSRLPKKSG